MPKLCYALKAEDQNLSNEDIAERIKKDLIEIWSRNTIYNHLPDEFKAKEKIKAGKQSHKNVTETSDTKLDQKLKEPIQIASTTSGQSINEPLSEPQLPIQTHDDFDGPTEEQLEAMEKYFKHHPEELMESRIKNLEDQLTRVRKENQELHFKYDPKPIKDPELAIDDGAVFENTIKLTKLEADWLAKQLNKFPSESQNINYFLIQQGGPGRIRVNLARSGFKH